MDELERGRFGTLGIDQNKIVEKYLQKYQDKRVLHVGSGGDLRVNQNVSSLVRKVVCGDKSLQEMANLKKNNLSNVNPTVLDVFHMPFRNESFDLILAIDVDPLYTYNYGARLQGLAQLYHTNSKGGELLVCNLYESGSCQLYEFVDNAIDIGYSIIRQDIGLDNEYKKRYLLVLGK